MKEFYDDLKEWALTNGFIKTSNIFFDENNNNCNWALYRKTNCDARECELTGKPDLFIEPYISKGKFFKYIKASIRGQCGGITFTVNSYHHDEADFINRFSYIEQALVNAWNSLCTDYCKYE